MNEDKKYERAKKRVEEIRGFFIHIFIYVVVNIGLFLLNIIASPNELWFYWPLFGWGFGVLAHGISVFGLGGLLGKEWEERKIKQIMEKMENE
jgi:hypothetical protein